MKGGSDAIPSRTETGPVGRGRRSHRSRDRRIHAAVVVALTPICVAKFRADADATTKLAALKALSASWEQGTFIEKGGWATRDGATSPDYQLARACAEKLAQAKTAAQ